MIRYTVFIIFIYFFLIHLYSQDRLTGKTFTTRSEVIARNGMAATHHPLASQIALDILKKGGSAVDAAIAANAFLGFADPAMNGIGGDMFVIVWDAENEKLWGLNASGKSPENLLLSHFEEQGLTYVPAAGPLPVTVPGTVDGWFELHGKFGKLSMWDILEPTIDYAREGIPMTEEIAEMMLYLERNLLSSYSPSGDISFHDFPNFVELYRKKGRFPVKGEIYSNPDLANTLETIANKGRDAFYQGEIARRMVQYMEEKGGFLSLDDLASHQSVWVDPVSTHYRGYDIWEMPPNDQGMAVLQILNILEGYDLANYGFGSKEHIHYFIEAKKLAYADRDTYYGDPYTYKIPIDKLLSKEYADERRKLIDPEYAQNFGPGLEAETHTIYLACADREGNMVSLIQSNSWLFGSFMVPDGLGFCLQNRGTGFTLQDNHVNTYAPQKRPLHSIIPAFITQDGQPFMSFGLTGGGMQPQGHVQIVMNIIDFGMNPQEAGDAPRIRHEYPFGRDNTGMIRLESGFDYEVVRELMKRGHTVGYGFERFGGYQAIMYDGTSYYGATESRKDGQAAGY